MKEGSEEVRERGSGKRRERENPAKVDVSLSAIYFIY